MKPNDELRFMGRSTTISARSMYPTTGPNLDIPCGIMVAQRNILEIEVDTRTVGRGNNTVFARNIGAITMPAPCLEEQQPSKGGIDPAFRGMKALEKLLKSMFSLKTERPIPLCRHLVGAGQGQEVVQIAVPIRRWYRPVLVSQS